MVVARRTGIRKTRKTPVRSIKFADIKHIGPEPDDNVKIEDRSDLALSRALAWYNYYFEIDDAKKWLVEYLAQTKSTPQLIKQIQTAPSWRTPPTCGYMAKLLLKGWTLPPASILFFNEMVAENARHGKVLVPTEKRSMPNLQERIRAKAIDTSARLEDMIVSWFAGEDRPSVYTFLTTEAPSPVAVSSIRNCIQGIIDDTVFDVSNTENSAAARKAMKARLADLESMLEEVERYSSNKKTTRKGPRKARTAKAVSADKVVSKLNYMKQFPELKLVSVNPTEIIGCQDLWTYNTKTRKLAHYIAVGPNGLTVSRSSITGFDVERSIVKTARKPDQTLDQILKATKAASRKIVAALSTSAAQPTGRINTDTILLKVIK